MIIKRARGFTKENIISIIVLLALVLKLCFLSLQLSRKIYIRGQVINIIILILIYYTLSIVFYRKKTAIIISLNIFLSIIILSNIVFYRAYGDLLPLSAIKQANQLPAVKYSVLMLFDKMDIMYFIDFPLLILLVFLIKNHTPYEQKIKYVIKSLSAALVLLIAAVCIKISVPSSIINGFNKVSIHNELGFLASMAFNGYNEINNKKMDKNTSENEFSNIKNELKEIINPKDDYRGKNLIVLQVESLQSMVVNSTYNGKEITPNINKLIKESAYFSNCYYQAGLGHTSDAELLVNTSLHPLVNETAYFEKVNNKFIAISTSMKDIGYGTYAFHGNSGHFWNRRKIYKTFEFDNFFELENFQKDDTFSLGLHDISFLNQSADIIKDLKEPFYTFLVTVSSHSPYDINNNFCQSGNIIEKYYNSINYADKAIGVFLEKLKQYGMLDNSILVLYGDHNALTITEKDNMKEFYNKDFTQDYSWQAYQRVPMIIRFPNGENKGLYNKTVGQIDTLPTLANLFGFKNQGYLGRDMFETGNNLVVLRDGSFVFGNLYYSSTNNLTYDINSGKVKSNDEILIGKARNQLRASDNIFKYDYYNRTSNK